VVCDHYFQNPPSRPEMQPAEDDDDTTKKQILSWRKRPIGLLNITWFSSDQKKEHTATHK
jgi:hypothetical protein